MKLDEAWVQAVLDEGFDGVELVALEDVGNRRSRVVRLFVDHPEGVTHELCARVSTAVAEALDAAGFRRRAVRPGGEFAGSGPSADQAGALRRAGGESGEGTDAPTRG